MLTLLVIYPKPQLPVMLGTAMDLITADGSNADAWGGKNWLR
jgi:hypothetical protein